MVLKLGVNQESVSTDGEGPCPPLVLDQSVKMPVANGWVERKRQTCKFLQARRQKEENQYTWDRENRLRAGGEIFYNVGTQGKQSSLKVSWAARAMSVIEGK